jgi:hypothetical protein
VRPDVSRCDVQATESEDEPGGEYERGFDMLAQPGGFDERNDAHE